MQDLLAVCESGLAPAEALVQHIYKDSKGNDTVGWGHLVKNGFSKAVCKLMFDEDTQAAINGCMSRIDFFHALDVPRQYVFVNLAYNMGIGGLLSFQKMLGHASKKEWEACADELSNSLLNEQVPNRLHPLIQILRTGILNFPINPNGVPT